MQFSPPATSPMDERLSMSQPQPVTIPQAVDVNGRYRQEHELAMNPSSPGRILGSSPPTSRPMTFGTIGNKAPVGYGRGMMSMSGSSGGSGQVYVLASSPPGIPHSGMSNYHPTTSFQPFAQVSLLFESRLIF